MLLGVSLAQLPIYAVLVAVLPSEQPIEWPGLLVWSLAGVPILLGANALLIRALQVSPLSLVTPYLSFTPAATLVTGGLVLGQTPQALGVLGVVIVAAGAFLLNGRARIAPGSLMALGVAGLFAFGNVVDRKAISYGPEAVYAGLITAFAAGVLALGPSLRRELWAARGAARWIALAGAVMAAALMLQLFSLQLLLVAYVDAVKRTGGNLVAVAIGAFLFAEGHLRRRLLAAAVMSAGVALILRSA